MFMLLIFLLIVAAVTVFPVMIAARIVRARNTGFGHALLALLLQSVLSGFLHQFMHRSLLAYLVSLLLGPAIYAMVMGTTYWRGLAISALFVVIVIVILLTVGPLILGSESALSVTV